MTNNFIIFYIKIYKKQPVKSNKSCKKRDQYLKMIIQIIILIIIIYLILILYFNGTPRREGEPILIGYYLPFIGKTIQFGDPIKLLNEMKKKYGGIFTLIIAGRRTHFLLNVVDFHQVFKNPKIFDFFPIVDRISYSLSGKENMKKENYDELMKMSIPKFYNHDSLFKLNEKFMKNTKKEMEGSIKESKQYLLEFIRKNIYEISSKSLFGESFNTKDSYEPFFKFDSKIELILGGLEFLTKEELKARDIVVKYLKEVDYTKSSEIFQIR
jgi:hypothetical protein